MLSFVLYDVQLVGARQYSLVPEGDAGHSKCPCWDARANSLTFVNAGDTSPSCAWKAELEGKPCFDAMYGNAGCRRYDLDKAHSGCNVANPEPFCSATWCWVDPTVCNLPHDTSGYFPSSTVIASDGEVRPLTYSYATCGNLNEFSANAALEQLQAFSPLRVVLPGDSGSGYTIVTADPGVAGVHGTRRDGSVLQFFANTMTAHGMQWVVAEVSPSSRNFASSSFTACVHEVALNLTDVCVGNIWPTAKRRRLAAFSSYIYQDAFYAISFRVGDTTTLPMAAALAAPFRPFSLWLWVAIVIAVLLVALAMVIVEGWSNVGDYPSASLVSSFGHSAFKALLTFPGGSGISHQPQSAIGKVIVLTFSFCTLVLCAQYTAFVTADLVSSETRAASEVKTFDDALRMRLLVCGLEATKSAFSERYPDSVGLYVGVRNSQEVLLAMDEGRCALGILTEDEWRRARMGDKSRPEPGSFYANVSSPLTYHCDTKLALPGAIYFLGNALAVRADLQAPLSWALTRQEQNTPYSAAANGAQRRFLRTPEGTSQPYCDALGQPLNRTSIDDSGRVGLDEFFGPVLYLVLVTILALLLGGLLSARDAWVLGNRRTNSVDVLLRRPPTIWERATGSGPRQRAARQVVASAERFSMTDCGPPPTRQEDVNIVSTLMYGRDRVSRSLNGSSPAFRNREDSPLVLSDVPMLLKLMRVHGVSASGGDSANDPGREDTTASLPNLAANMRILQRARGNLRSKPKRQTKLATGLSAAARIRSCDAAGKSECASACESSEAMSA